MTFENPNADFLPPSFQPIFQKDRDNLHTTPSPARLQTSFSSSGRSSHALPLSQTQIVTSQPQISKLQRSTSIQRLGLSLRPTCSTHKQMITRICMENDCISEANVNNNHNRLQCEKCIELTHSPQHCVKKIEEYILLMQSNEQLSQHQNRLISPLVNKLTYPPFFNDLTGLLNDIKSEVISQVDFIQETIKTLYKQAIETPQNQSPPITLRGLNEELLNIQSKQRFFQTIAAKNFFEISASEFDQSIKLTAPPLYTFESLIESSTQRYTQLSSIFTSSVMVFKQQIIDELQKLFAAVSLTVPLNKQPVNASINGGSGGGGGGGDPLLKSLQESLEKAERELRKKKRSVQCLQQQIEAILAKQKKAPTAQTSCQQSFPYHFYNKSCGHLIAKGTQGNCIPIFECCKQAFVCVECHDLKQRHAAKTTNPSKRYCYNCLTVFTVNYDTSVLVNCNSCIAR